MTPTLLILLAACATPSPYFRAVPATRVTVDGSVFDVRVRGDLAEALRVNSQYAPRAGPIPARAAVAMAQVSGCRVTEVRGDQALLLGFLACGGAPAPRPVAVLAPSYSCMEVDRWSNGGLGVEHVEFDCDPN